ncbi:MAG: hypothetical protein M1812_001762 [Candelaria pacifica]|nr:MAG: hypothetical protein M1812_001762 [Candelaria pacifica]
MPSSGPQKHDLVQTTLSSTFFNHNKHEKDETRSPYFTKPSQTSPTPDQSPTSENDNINPSSPSSNDQNTLSTNFKKLKTSTSSPSSPSASRKRNEVLAQTATETKRLLPIILNLLPSAPATGILYTNLDLPTLSQRYCPHYTQPQNNTKQGTSIRILNSDTLDAAITLSQQHSPPPSSKTPICILNMANAQHGGGGWLKGALAQEESLCYRTSLSFTLKRKFYPLPEISGIYSPTVIIIRRNLDEGHTLLDLNKPDDLPIVSVVSVAAIRDPPLTGDGKRYLREGDRESMKERIRIVLRIAAFRRHRRLVLGALGCGAFNNPREEVVRCWREVFEEREFGGGWWESVVFAVLDESGGDEDGNYAVFYRGLEGLVV